MRKPRVAVPHFLRSVSKTRLKKKRRESRLPMLRYSWTTSPSRQINMSEGQWSKSHRQDWIRLRMAPTSSPCPQDLWVWWTNSPSTLTSRNKRRNYHRTITLKSTTRIRTTTVKLLALYLTFKTTMQQSLSSGTISTPTEAEFKHALAYQPTHRSQSKPPMEIAFKLLFTRLSQIEPKTNPKVSRPLQPPWILTSQ